MSHIPSAVNLCAYPRVLLSLWLTDCVLTLIMYYSCNDVSFPSLCEFSYRLCIAKCVNSSWNLSSRSSTVASRLGGGGLLLSSVSGGVALSAATVGGLLIRGDRWYALVSSC